jgi:hypothetical protein
MTLTNLITKIITTPMSIATKAIKTQIQTTAIPIRTEGDKTHQSMGQKLI